MDAKRAVLDFLEFPYDTALDLPKIVLMGNRQIFVENFTALLEYKRDNIKLKAKGGIIEIIGNDFEINAICSGSVSVCGSVQTVRLI